MYSNLFEKLSKREMKIETYILIFQTQIKNYRKDKCSIQDGFTNGGTSNVTAHITLKKIIMDFFFYWNWKLNL